MNIILDTSIILRQPKILGTRMPDTKILVLESVLGELKHRAFLRGSKNDWRIDIVEEARREGTIMVIFDPIIPPEMLADESVIFGRTDMAILKVALDLISNNNDATIATQDKDLIRIANARGVKTLDENDVVLLIHNNPSFEDEVAQEIKKQENVEKNNFYFGIGIGVLLTVTSYVIFRNLAFIISTINVWLTLIIILIIGICLFILREKRRFEYGILEFFVGTIAIVLLFDLPKFDYKNLNIDLDFALKILGGLYVMVRGQDNIVKSQQDKKFGLWLKDNWGIGG